MQQEHGKDKNAKRKKARTWTEAAKLVLEMFPKTPMTHKEIFGVVRSQGLKDVSGPASLACLNAMLHAHSRGSTAMFYRVAGATSVFGLTTDIPECATRLEVDEDESDADDDEDEDSDENNDGDKKKTSDTDKSQILQKCRKEKVLYVKFPPGYKPPNYPVVNLDASNLLTSSSPATTTTNCDRVNSSNIQNTSSIGQSSLPTSESIPSIASTREMRSSHNGLLAWNSGKLSGTDSSKWNGRDKSNKGIKPVTIHLTLPTTESGHSPVKISHHSNNHHQKAVKHALRQQQKRRRRNTAIAASGGTINTSNMAPPPPPAPLPRIIMKPLIPPPAHPSTTVSSYTRRMVTRPTSSSLLTSESKSKIPPSVFAEPPSNRRFKPRKRNQKKLSTAAQIAQTKKGCIDLETPDSILVRTELRALLNKHTFASLPSAYQYQLVQLLPPVDKVIGSDTGVRLAPSALSNEFFSFSCQEWWERLSEGEFTHENQLKRKWDDERERSKLDPWKLKHFEPVWSQKTIPDLPESPSPPKRSSFVVNTTSEKTKTSLECSTSKSSTRSSTVIGKHVPALKLKPLLRKNMGIASILKPINGEILSSNSSGGSSNIVNETTSSFRATKQRNDSELSNSSSTSSSNSSESSSTSSANESLMLNRVTPDLIDEPRIPSAASSSSGTSESDQTTDPVKIITDHSTPDLTRKRKMSGILETIEEGIEETSKKQKLLAAPSSDDSQGTILPGSNITPVQQEVNKTEKFTSLKTTKDSCYQIQQISRHKQPVIRTAFTSASGSPIPGLVPPITIRSVPVSSSKNGGSSSRSSDGINMERSYQICQAVFESSRNRSQFLQSGQLHFKNKEDLALATTSSSPSVTMAASLVVASPQVLLSDLVTTASVTSLQTTTREENIVSNVDELRSQVIVKANRIRGETPNNTSLVVITPISNNTFSTSVVAPPSPIYVQAEQSGKLVEAELILPQESIAVPSNKQTAISTSLPVKTAVEQSLIVANSQQDCCPQEQQPQKQPAQRQQVIVVAGKATELASTSVLTNEMRQDSSSIERNDSQCTVLGKQSIESISVDKVTPVMAVELLTPCHTPQATSVELDGGRFQVENAEPLENNNTETVLNSINKLSETMKVVESNQYHQEENQPFEPVLLPDGTIPVLVVQDLPIGQSGVFNENSELLPNLPSMYNPQRPQSAPISQGVDKDKALLQRSASFQDFHMFEIPNVLQQQPFTSIRKKLNQHEPLTVNYSTPPSPALTANYAGNELVTHSSGNLQTLTTISSSSVQDCPQQQSAIHAKNINLLINHSPVYQTSPMQNTLASLSHNVPTSVPLTANLFSPGSILIAHGQSSVNHQYQVNENRSMVTVVPSIPPFPVMSAGFNFSPANGVPLMSSDDRSPNHFASPIYVNSGTAVAPQNNLIGSGGVPTSEPPSTNGGNCACNLKAMVMCCKCGAFCHDDCIGPSKLCVTCLIR